MSGKSTLRGTLSEESILIRKPLEYKPPGVCELPTEVLGKSRGGNIVLFPGTLTVLKYLPRSDTQNSPPASGGRPFREPLPVPSLSKFKEEASSVMADVPTVLRYVCRSASVAFRRIRNRWEHFPCGHAAYRLRVRSRAEKVSRLLSVYRHHIPKPLMISSTILPNIVGRLSCLYHGVFKIRAGVPSLESSENFQLQVQDRVNVQKEVHPISTVSFVPNILSVVSQSVLYVLAHPNVFALGQRVPQRIDCISLFDGAKMLTEPSHTSHRLPLFAMCHSLPEMRAICQGDC